MSSLMNEYHSMNSPVQQLPWPAAVMAKLPNLTHLHYTVSILCLTAGVGAVAGSCVLVLNHSHKSVLARTAGTTGCVADPEHQTAVSAVVPGVAVAVVAAAGDVPAAAAGYGVSSHACPW